MVFPEIDPVIVQFGPLAVRWYGLMYLVGFLAGWWLLRRRAASPGSGWTREEVGDLLFYSALGVILGGRLGYVLFYGWERLLEDPLFVLRIQEGGMSFHGGMLGVLVAAAWFAHRTGRHFIDVTDFGAPVVPVGLGAGRLGNFINAELWGRTTDAPWGIVFPGGGLSPRHPSQLYEALLEGVVLFVLLWWFSSRPRPRYTVSGLFLLGYGTFRFAVEFFREPDAHLGFLFLDWVTMGQLLSLPMIVAGCVFFAVGRRADTHAAV
jgi:phosphatidylglycerol:prolipoprotein diacylglycerol transferase